MNSTLNKSFRLGLVATALIAGFASVGTAADLPQVHVKYADLNVDSAAGASVLYQRIRVAANEVCPTADSHNLGSRSAAKSCRAHAIAEAVAAVRNANLTQVYDLKTGVTPSARFASIR